jgi:hypothetical protein
MKLKALILSISLALLTLSTGCSSTIKLTSTAAENRISLTGDPASWSGNLNYLPDEKVAIGVSNNEDYFYLCLITSDMGKVMPMFAKGFIVWLRTESDDASTIGIRYPLHNIADESRIMLDPGRFREKGGGVLIAQLIKKQDEIRILNKDKFPVRVVPTADSSALMAKLGYSNDQFIYELRVPLKIDEQNKYGINAHPGEKLYITFETERPERENYRGQDNQRGMKPPDNGSSYPGGYNSMNPGNNNRMPFEPIDFSVEVTLK